MSDHGCPLCGGKTIKDETFCRSCQEIARSSDPNSLLQPPVTKKEKPEKVEPINKVKAAIGDIERILSISTITHSKKRKQNTHTENENIKDHKEDYKLYFATKIFVGLIIVIIACVAYVHFSDNNRAQEEKVYWSQSIDKNTSIGYANYLKEYPNGRFSTIAEEKIRELKDQELAAMNSLKSSTDIDEHLVYIQEYPNSPYALQIKNKIDKLGWEAALKENTADAYQSYIENVELGNYTGGYKDLAKEKFLYYSNLKPLEGDERNKLLIVAESLFKAIAKKDIKALENALSSKPQVFLNMKGLEKGALIDSIKKIAKKENDKQSSFTLLKEQTSILKDIANTYSISTSVVEKTNSKTDTLNFRIVLNDSLKIEKLLVIK